MKKFPFYFALGVGLVAFIALVTVYSYKTNKNALGTDRGVDLNEAPAVQESTEIAGNSDASSEEKIADKKTTEDKSLETGNSTSDKDELKKEREENKEIENASEVESVISAGAEPEKNDKEKDYSLEYDGEKALIWPIEGQVIMPFSMESTVFYKTLNQYKCSPAMLIAGEEGAIVLSAYEGIVTRIYEDNELGKVVEVSLGNGYKLYYGQLKDICVKENEKLSLGQEIGKIAEPTRFYSKEGNHLYFEMTKEDNPENPKEHFKEE